jgi:hypothetical protein
MSFLMRRRPRNESGSCGSCTGKREYPERMSVSTRAWSRISEAERVTTSCIDRVVSEYGAKMSRSSVPAWVS